MKKAVIFDLDGTLSDSIASMKYCSDLALEPFGFGPFTIDQYKYFVGDGAANLIRRAIRAGALERLREKTGGQFSPEEAQTLQEEAQEQYFEAAFARYREIFRENCMYRVKPYSGIEELLQKLKERKVRIAVLSNKPHEETVRVIHSLFGEDCFDVIRGQMEGVAIKPSPEGVFRILEQLGLSAGEILYLGDTATDMQTGKRAGAFTVGALWGFRERTELEQAHADAIIGYPTELLAYL